MSEELPKLVDVFKIGDNTFPNSLEEHVDISTKHIDECFSEHAELFAWYATAYELALDVEARLKKELAETYAHADYKARMDAQASGIKMTEKKVENTVITSELYRKVYEDYLEAKRNTGLLKAAKEAMIHRRDMLIQRGSTYRAEIQSDITLREQVAKGTIK